MTEASIHSFKKHQWEIYDGYTPRRSGDLDCGDMSPLWLHGATLTRYSTVTVVVGV
jgi:hypothetical protein